MTLLLSNDDVEAALAMPDCLEAMEVAYRDLGLMQGGNGIRSEVLTPTARDDALYSLLTMSGVVPRFGIGAVRINSDILTWPSSSGGMRRVKVPAAPNQRYVGLVLLFSTHSGEPLAIYPDGIVQRMRVGATCGLAAKYLARPDARDVALLGTGWQAGGQVMAICAVRNIERIRCYSPHRERREAFARAMQAKLGIEISPVATRAGSRVGCRHRHVRDQQHGAGIRPRMAGTGHACEQPEATRARRHRRCCGRRGIRPCARCRCQDRPHGRRRSGAGNRAPKSRVRPQDRAIDPSGAVRSCCSAGRRAVDPVATPHCSSIMPDWVTSSPLPGT